jgi:hypothetical protein
MGAQTIRATNPILGYHSNNVIINEVEQVRTKMDANENREITEMGGQLGAGVTQNKVEDVEEVIDFQDEPSECLSMNKELPFCRFCWVNETSEENPLMSSCKCRGGV